ncbi:PRC-barrel domain-containing protein [Stomatohabitans albus]|uniref:PRC-barrel domain-containing protein n=1 Tax=Stomatohabitans albus TaxID=3110766 RepID=UPI00300C268A
MSQLMTATRIVGLPVVDLATSQVHGTVREILYHPYEGALMAFSLSDTGFFGRKLRTYVPVDQVSAIGRDAVMIADDTALVEPSTHPLPDLDHPEQSNVIGANVMTTDGVHLGRVVDLVVMVGGDGTVVGYRIHTEEGRASYIPLPTQISVSGTNLVVPSDLRDFVRDDLVGLGAAVDAFRDRVGI